MSFPREVLLAGIAIADGLTAGVQSDVTWTPVTSTNGNGDEIFGAPQPLKCVLDQTRRQVTTASGRIATVVATLTFPRGGVNIGPMDKITLPDGTTGPLILDGPDSVFDPVTGRGFITTIHIGEVSSNRGA